jgi:hypothetical protein
VQVKQAKCSTTTTLCGLVFFLSLFCPTNTLTVNFFFKHVCVHMRSHYNNMLDIGYGMMT